MFESFGDRVVDYGLDRGYYWCIRVTDLGIPCGYVFIPKGSRVVANEDYETNLDLYGGMTFFDRCIIKDHDEYRTYRVVGFDMGHACDIDYRDGKPVCIRTVSDCRKEITKVIDQVIAIDALI